MIAMLNKTLAGTLKSEGEEVSSQKEASFDKNPLKMVKYGHHFHEQHKITLEKVLLDPIIMILKCDFFTHFGSCFLKLHDVSTSHLEALAT